MPEFCEVGYSATHSITDVFLTAFHSIPSSDSSSEAPLYPESDHEATDPKTSLRSAAQRNTQTQSDPAKLAHFFCSTTCHPRACAAVSDSHSDQLLRTLHPSTSVRASNAHFLRLSQLAPLLLRCGDVHPHPGPLRVAHANVTSLRLQRHTVAEWRVDVVLPLPWSLTAPDPRNAPSCTFCLTGSSR